MTQALQLRQRCRLIAEGVLTLDDVDRGKLPRQRWTQMVVGIGVLGMVARALTLAMEGALFIVVAAVGLVAAGLYDITFKIQQIE